MVRARLRPCGCAVDPGRRTGARLEMSNTLLPPVASPPAARHSDALCVAVVPVSSIHGGVCSESAAGAVATGAPPLAERSDGEPDGVPN